jgi:hypothetical protein
LIGSAFASRSISFCSVSGGSDAPSTQQQSRLLMPNVYSEPALFAAMRLTL